MVDWMGMLFGVNPFVEVLQRSKVDVLVLDFLEQAAQWFLPNAFCIHITMEMGCCISLILDGATNGADEPQNPTSGMCAVTLWISTITSGATKAHSDAEQLCKNETHHGLETKDYSPRISSCNFSTDVISRDFNLSSMAFPHGWIEAFRAGAAARVRCAIA